MWEGITLHDPTEEVALIKSLTPRGNFMSAAHTRKYYRRHWYPEIISRDTYDTWKDKGETIEQVCQRRAREILEQHKPVPLERGVGSELEHIMRQFMPDFEFE
jgi:trimethylamine--corrinoid protein Co-methyltransferase